MVATHRARGVHCGIQPNRWEALEWPSWNTVLGLLWADLDFGLLTKFEALEGFHPNATPHDCNTIDLVAIRGSYCNIFIKWLQYVPIMQQTKCVAIWLQYVQLVVAIDVCYCNHLRIMLQLVGIIAMALGSYISIDFRCNYLVLLQLY
jgi:hypothetical protein